MVLTCDFGVLWLSTKLAFAVTISWLAYSQFLLSPCILHLSLMACRLQEDSTWSRACVFGRADTESGFLDTAYWLTENLGRRDLYCQFKHSIPD